MCEVAEIRNGVLLKICDIAKKTNDRVSEKSFKKTVRILLMPYRIRMYVTSDLLSFHYCNVCDFSRLLRKTVKQISTGVSTI